jgi:hypothetical protein
MVKFILGTFGVIGLIAFIVALIVFGPFVSIWSLNTLFGLGIAYTFKTWLAAIWIQMVTFGGVQTAVKSKKD